MTDVSKPLKPELQAWMDAWKTCTQTVLSQVSGQPQVFDVVSETFSVAGTDLRYTVTPAGAVQGEMGIRLNCASAIRLARKFLGEPAPQTPEEPVSPDDKQAALVGDSDREALEELMRQIAGLVATAAAPAVGGEIRFQVSRAEDPWTWVPAAALSLGTRDEAGVEIRLEIRISPALAAALAPRPGAAPAAVSTPPVTLNMPESGYRRLRDVGLGVKLRFGTRRMLLRDVLALSSGLVVELDNPVQSPVDLLLDGRVIARGEVVIIDGKYGLRITDVADPAGPAVQAV